MNRALFAAMTKIHGKNMLNYAIGSVLYEWLVIWIYPSIAKSAAMNTVLQSMPESLQKTFGLQGGGWQKLGDYLGTEYYGLIFIIVLCAFSIMTAVSLMARMVDRGAMAYFLATPASRRAIATTQAVVLELGIFVVCAFTTVGGIVGSAVLVPDGKLDTGLFVQANVLAFLLFSVISGYCFLCSSVLNDEKRALGVAAGVTVVEFAVHLVSNLSDKLSWMKYLSVFTTFDVQSVLRGSSHLVPTALALLCAAVVLFAVAIQWFSRRDLPL